MIDVTSSFLISSCVCVLISIASQLHTVDLFNSDAWAYVFMMVFGFTNGYFGSLCMMYGPRYDHHAVHFDLYIDY